MPPLATLCSVLFPGAGQYVIGLGFIAWASVFARTVMAVFLSILVLPIGIVLAIFFWLLPTYELQKDMRKVPRR